MTAYTKTAHKAGTTDYEVSVHYLVPLPDPSSEGNMGLEGYDDAWEARRDLPTEEEAMARAALIGSKVRTTQPTAIVSDVEVREIEWVGESWPDEKHGIVHDACSETRWVRYGSWDKDDELSWDEERVRP
jgi:hypothetical protein